MDRKSKCAALYPGSFDTPTNGHLNIIGRAARLFSRVHVAVANNTSKDPLLTVEERVELLRRIVAGVAMDNVEVASFNGLTVDYARRIGACAIVRGLRAVSDFEYELQMAWMNQQLAPEIETIYFAPSMENTFLSSSTTLEVLRLGGDITQFVPREVEDFLREKMKDPAFAARLRR